DYCHLPSTDRGLRVRLVLVNRVRKRTAQSPRGVGLSSRTSASSANRWARRLATQVNAVLASYPEADPEDVRLTLISLQSPPLTRLNRSLRRGRGFAAFTR